MTTIIIDCMTYLLWAKMDCPLTIRTTRATEKANMDSDDTNQYRPKVPIHHHGPRSQQGVAKSSSTRSNLPDYGSICDLPTLHKLRLRWEDGWAFAVYKSKLASKPCLGDILLRTRGRQSKSKCLSYTLYKDTKERGSRQKLIFSEQFYFSLQDTGKEDADLQAWSHPGVL